MRRFIGLAVAAFVMMSNFAVPVMAAGAESGTIQLNGTTPGRTYEIYKIFDLTVSDVVNQEYKNHEYKITDKFIGFFESYANESQHYQDFLNAYTGTDKSIHGKAAAYVGSFEADENKMSEELQLFALDVKAYAIAKDISPDKMSESSDTSVVFDKLPFGYYLVCPTDSSNDFRCNLITVNKSDRIEINLKAVYPDIPEKSVVKSTDNGLVIKEDDPAYSLGDIVEYQVKSEVPDIYGYKSYMFVIKDTMSQGLTFNNDIVVTIGEKKLEENYNVKVSVIDENTVIEIAFGKQIDDKQIFDAADLFRGKKGEPIVITYSATVNEFAEVGEVGNENDVEIIYSIDPKNSHGENGTGITKKDEDRNRTKVFTFKLEGLKVDGKDVKLENARFSLWTTNVPKYEYKEEIKNDYNPPLYKVATSVTISEGIVTRTFDDKITGKDGKFSYQIGSGTYYLFEEDAPEGFNKMTEPVIFVVGTEYKGKELTVLQVNNEKYDHDTGISGIIKTTIVNNKGGILPGTGGMGTTVFMMCGGLLMCGSIVGMLISGRRKAKKSH